MSINEHQMYQPVVFTVSEAVILATAGDPAVAVRYGLTDRAGNWSGFSPTYFVNAQTSTK